MTLAATCGDDWGAVISRKRRSSQGLLPRLLAHDIVCDAIDCSIQHQVALQEEFFDLTRVHILAACKHAENEYPFGAGNSQCSPNRE